MKLARIVRGTMVALATIGMLIPQLALGAPTVAGQLGPTVRDVALESGGRLRGQVLDGQGVPVPGIQVAIAQQGHVIATATTDAQGRFEVTGLRGGVYQVATDRGTAMYRLWAPRTAPPAAASSALIVDDGTIVRGGMGGGGVIGFLSNPWVLGAIVAAAIAIPLAIDQDNAS